MALQRPYDINIRGQTIDGNEDYTLRWRITGDISVAYRVIVKNNETDNEVYNSGKVVSYSTSHTIPSGNMPNGEEYGLIVRLYDDNDNTRDSDRVVFQASGRPIVTVDPIGIVSNQSYEFSATYEQNENIAMQSYSVYLFNENKQLLTQSEVKIDLPLEHIFYNLQSESQYYIEFRATSRNGLVGTTGLISFDVLYSQPEINIEISAENTEDAGIYLNWNVIQIIGELIDTEKSLEELFLEDEDDINNHMLNLVDNGVVNFDEGFNVNKDFSMGIWIKDFNNRESILEISGSNGRYALEYDQVDQRFYLDKRVGSVNYIFRSDKVITKNVFVKIRQINRDVEITAIDL